MSGRERRVNVPQRKTKQQPVAPTPRQAPAYGRPAPAPAPAPKQTKPARQGKDQQAKPKQAGNGRRQQQRGGARGQGRQRSSPKANELPSNHPLRSVTWTRVVEHDLGEGVLTVVAEHDGTLGRIKAAEGAEFQPAGTRLHLKQETATVGRLMGLAQVERLSPQARQQLVTALTALVRESSTHFLKGFWNVAGHVNIKTHAYQLLPGIGPKKAEEIITARQASGGFSSFEALEDAVGLDGAALLGARFAEELLDHNLQPRLVTMLLPVKA